MKTCKGLAALSLLMSSTVLAQGANIDVTVIPAYSAGQTAPPRDGFTVCVGTTADRDKYGSQLTPSNGVANTAFKNLAVNTQVVITVSKAGFAGLERTITTKADWNNHVSVNPASGSGGPTCTAAAPSTTVRLDGTAIYPVSPSTATTPTTTTSTLPKPPRLGEQTLTHWGAQLHSSEYKTLDCRIFGSDYVITGISGRQGDGIDQISVRCTRTNSTGRVGWQTSMTTTFGGTAGRASYERVCAGSYAVVGIRGKLVNDQVRGLVLRCMPIVGGRVDFAARQSPWENDIVGGDTGAAWGPNDCSGGRSARALRVGKDIFRTNIPLGNLFAPYVIAAVQLICEEPTYQP